MKTQAVLPVWVLVVGCGTPERAAVDVKIERGCGPARCEETLSGDGLLVVSDGTGTGDLARRRGTKTLYVELPADQGRLVILEIGYDDRAPRVRYHELHQGEVRFRGRIEGAEVTEPTKHARGSFVFVAQDGGERREISGVVRIVADSVEEGRDSAPSGTYAYGCGGEIVIVEPEPVPEPPPVDSPPLPDDPPPPVPPILPPAPPDLPPPLPDPAYPDASDRGGCSGDDPPDSEEADSETGGCDGDDPPDESTESCEGDRARAVVAPAMLHAVRRIWSYLWPILPAAVTNRWRRVRRRSSEPADRIEWS